MTNHEVGNLLFVFRGLENEVQTQEPHWKVFEKSRDNICVSVLSFILEIIGVDMTMIDPYISYINKQIGANCLMTTYAISMVFCASARRLLCFAVSVILILWLANCLEHHAPCSPSHFNSMCSL